MTIAIIIIAIVLLILIFIFATYNSLVKLKNLVKEAFSTMDVYLKKRWDLVPNLVETVKGYMTHEKDTLESIVNIRNKSYNSMSDDEKIKADKEIRNGISKIFVLAENYPDLKASQNFLELSNNISTVESEIANSRKYYNAVVRDYNNKIEMFPSNIVASIFGYKQKEMFEIDEAQRENVKVEF